MATLAEKKHYIFIGNPGVGKSTLLNALLGKVLFKSGITAGPGLTQQLQTQVLDNGIFIDTPGLHDPASRERAAQEIHKGLQMDGYYKIFFVIMLDSGRLRTVDLALMKIVLDALQDTPVQGSYSIIVSKVSPQVWDSVSGNPEFAALLFSGLPHKSVYDFPFFWSPQLHDQNDVLVTMPEDLRKFILQERPCVRIQKGSVRPLQFDRMEKEEKMFQAILQQMAASQAMMQQQIALLSDMVKELHERNKQDQGLFGIPVIGWVARAFHDIVTSVAR